MNLDLLQWKYQGFDSSPVCPQCGEMGEESHDCQSNNDEICTCCDECKARCQLFTREKSNVLSKKLRFVSGLPRSGSTLLCNVLAQNPSFHVTSTSGILDVLVMIRNQWDQMDAFKATPNEEGKQRVLKSILTAYHELGPNRDAGGLEHITFDKSRGWLAYMEMAENILGEKAKVLVPVRDIRDVLASFEKLWRANAHSRAFPQEMAALPKWRTVEGRCEVLAMADQVVGAAYNCIKDALHRGYRDRMHFVPYDALTTNPRKTMAGIYEFLEEEPYEHDFNNVKQVTVEDDGVHGMGPTLHKIRPKILPQTPQWPTVLGKAAEPYAKLELW